MKKKKVYWQPEYNDNGRLIGHEDDKDPPFSFCVWRYRKNLLEYYPKCNPLRLEDGDVEEPTYMD